MYISSKESIGLRRSCTEVRRPSFWWFSEKPGIPPQVPQKGDYTHLVNFLRLSSILKIVLFGGCSSRVLGGLLRKTAVSGVMSGSRAENTCAAVPTAAGVQKTERPGLDRQKSTIENILPRERYQPVAEIYLQCLPCATQMQTRR